MNKLFAGDSCFLINAGRNYFYEIYNNNNAQLKNAVSVYLDNMDIFEETCDLINNGCSAKYNFKEHKFEYCEEINPEFDFEKAKKDYNIFHIDEFLKDIAQNVFKNKATTNKIKCIQLYLKSKLIKGFNCELEYKKSATQMIRKSGETSIKKLFDKILANTFLSNIEKQKKMQKKDLIESKTIDPFIN